MLLDIHVAHHISSIHMLKVMMAISGLQFVKLLYLICIIMKFLGLEQFYAFKG